MASGRLMAGAMIILFVLVVNTMAAFITTGATTSGSVTGCTSSDTNTTCEAVGKTSFLASVLDVTFTGFTGAPTIINVLWGVLMGVLLTVAVLLIVLAFIPFTNS